MMMMRMVMIISMRMIVNTLPYISSKIRHIPWIMVLTACRSD